MIKKRILSIIPARGGSKGILKKNIQDINGKPLIFWTIKASVDSAFISETVVSSDSDDILNIALDLNVLTIKRPDSISLDETPSEPVIEHALNYFTELGKRFDYVILLQPTSPLRNSNDVDDSIKILFSNKDASALISVKEIDNKILKSFVDNNKGFIEGIRNNKIPFLRRQDLPKTYISNGAIYIIKVEEFLKNKSLFTENTLKYVMSEDKSIDIDTLDDLEYLRKILL